MRLFLEAGEISRLLRYVFRLENDLVRRNANSEIVYCLSQRIEEHYKLQFSAIFMILVIICNVVKMSCMTWIAWKQDSEPLVTLGDVISSFLDRPDTMTGNNVWLSDTIFRTKKFLGGG